MSGIILTQPTSQASSTTSADIEETIMPNTIEAVDIIDASSCPSFKWFISLHDLTTNKTRSVECNALHDFSTNDIRFYLGPILGSVLDVDIQVTNGPNSNELLLSIENLSNTNTISVCIFRI